MPGGIAAHRLLRACWLRVSGGLDRADAAARAVLAQAVQTAAGAMLDNPGPTAATPGL